MNANDVIERYVADVALQLPRKQRNDVAFELRSLLNEELQGKAEGAGRAADATMATELVRSFGRPADVAARYRPTLTIIDPADGHAFLRAAVIGLAIIWGLGLLVHLGPAFSGESDFLTALGRWWTAAVIPSPWWPGILVVGFGAAAWTRRRWPQTSEWKPRTDNLDHASRAAMVLGVLSILCGVFLLFNPRWILETVWGGGAAQAAYDALTYTETYRQRQGWWLLVLLLLNVPMYIAVIVNGRWSALMRSIEVGLGVATSAVMAWTILDGPVFITPVSDRAFKFALVLTVVFTLVSYGVRMYRGVRPTPDFQIQA